MEILRARIKYKGRTHNTECGAALAQSWFWAVSCCFRIGSGTTLIGWRVPPFSIFVLPPWIRTRFGGLVHEFPWSASVGILESWIHRNGRLSSYL